MLDMSAPVSELLEHIYNRLADQACRYVIHSLGLTDHIKNHIYINSDFKAPSKSSDGKNRYPILAESNFKGTIKYNPNPTGLKVDVTTTGQYLDPAQHRRDNLHTKPVFLDIEHGILLTERFYPTNLTVECELSLTDPVIAYDSLTRFHNIFLKGEYLTLTDLYYDYRLPIPIVHWLYALSKLCGIEKCAFGKWLSHHSNRQIKRNVSKRIKNRSVELVVAKPDFEALMFLDFTPDQLATTQSGKSALLTTLSFTITLQFQRPNELYLEYPICINNQMVPDMLIPPDKREDPYNFEKFRKQKYTYNVIDPVFQQMKMLMMQPRRLPWYDDWTIPGSSPMKADDALAFLIGVVTLDVEPKITDQTPMADQIEPKPATYTEINILEDLDKYKLTDKVIHYFQEDPQRALDSSSEYNIGVFADNIQLGASELQFDGKILRIPNNHGINRIYRLVLAHTPQKNIPNILPWYWVMDCVIDTSR